MAAKKPVYVLMQNDFVHSVYAKETGPHGVQAAMKTIAGREPWRHWDILSGGTRCRGTAPGQPTVHLHYSPHQVQ